MGDRLGIPCGVGFSFSFFLFFIYSIYFTFFNNQLLIIYNISIERKKCFGITRLLRHILYTILIIGHTYVSSQSILFFLLSFFSASKANRKTIYFSQRLYRSTRNRFAERRWCSTQYMCFWFAIVNWFVSVFNYCGCMIGAEFEVGCYFSFICV